MAKGGQPAQQEEDGESMSAWFRRVFKEHPSWLKGRSNAAVVERWEKEHPGRTFGPSERNSCNNVKSILRKHRRKRGPKPAEDVLAELPIHRVSRANLELLEERIDDCISLARALDREGLDAVAKMLRRARNEIVWKQGQ